jgi:type IV pilus assembly protein PilM
MFDFLKNIFNSKGDAVLGIDVGPSSIKLVELRKKKGRAILGTYGALALGPYAGIEVGRATSLPPQKIAEALLDLLREAGATTKRCGLSIPMSSSLLTIIEVPAVDEKQLAQMIPIEARKYVPLPMSEVSIDWWVIPKEQTGITDAPTDAPASQTPGAPVQRPQEKLTVLLVVIHKEAVLNAQEIVRLASLDASFFEIEIFSTLRSVLDHDSGSVLIMDMGAGSTKLYIVDRGILRVSHIITRGSQDLTLAISKSINVSVEQAEVMKREKGLSMTEGDANLSSVMLSSVNYIFAETNRVIMNYQKKYNKNVSKVFLTGGGSALRGFSEMAQKELQTEVHLADPFAKVDSPAYLSKILKQSGPEFAVSVGLAMRRLQDLK